MYSELNIRINNLEETQKFAAILSKLIAKPFFICLNGPIGSGKTTFAKHLINQFSEKKINVPSPTFPIVQIYDLKKLRFGTTIYLELRIKNFLILILILQ